MNNSMRLGSLAELIQAELRGDASCLISAIAPLSNAGAGQITFLGSAKYLSQLKSTKASAVLLAAEYAEHCTTNMLIVDKPRLALAKLMTALQPKKLVTAGIHSTAVIGEHCSISASASIAANAVIGDRVTIGSGTVIGPGVSIGEGVTLGMNCRVYANVTLYHDIKIGNDVVIHSGVVIGADGFSFEPDERGQWVKMAQIGSVIIGNEVEIGANTAIDRGALEDTLIGNGVKLDNFVMVAHNVKIGDHTVIAGCTGIAGSTKIGRHCVIAGGCAITGHISIADKVIISGMAMVTRSLTEPGVYSSGTGILPRKQWQKSAIRFKQLDDMYQRLKLLEQKNGK